MDIKSNMNLPPIKTLALKKLESTFNRYLNLDSESPALLKPLIEKVMGIHIQRPKISLFFSFHADGVQLSTDAPEIVNTEIYTTLFQLMRLKKNKSSSLVNAELHIKGDVDTAQLFHQLFEKHHIDWEEHLSKIIGDVTAHKMMRLFKKSSEFLNKHKEKTAQDITDYCQEEIMLLPSNNEVEIFRCDVDALRLQIDRLEARIHLLKKNNLIHHIEPSTKSPLLIEGRGQGEG